MKEEHPVYAMFSYNETFNDVNNTGASQHLSKETTASIQ